MTRERWGGLLLLGLLLGSLFAWRLVQRRGEPETPFVRAAQDLELPSSMTACGLDAECAAVAFEFCCGRVEGAINRSQRPAYDALNLRRRGLAGKCASDEPCPKRPPSGLAPRCVRGECILTR